ncbi:hypothetical protein S7335_3449 [Synechococcus sp. PCC 7335]|nr:hypothetical protein [Synechococcus sp. PCC 7335]EDX85746.1 hypothetical protein S7335_3449 [Synechococcus sp. PCC 7335]
MIVFTGLTGSFVTKDLYQFIDEGKDGTSAEINFRIYLKEQIIRK